MVGCVESDLGKLLSFNVLGIRRFDSPNKQTAGLQGWQNVGEVLCGNGVAVT
jgi:hypothetical protein